MTMAPDIQEMGKRIARLLDKPEPKVSDATFRADTAEREREAATIAILVGSMLLNDIRRIADALEQSNADSVNRQSLFADKPHG